MSDPTANRPHPTVRAVLAERKKRGVPRFNSLSVDGARRLLEGLWALPEEPEPVGMVRTVTIDGPGGDLPIRIYTPDGSPPFPMLMYFHGGGFVLGSIDVDDGICRALTNEIGCIVLSVEYRLAPEDPFPAAVEDCLAATTWAAERGAEIHGDSGRVAVGGESAGGTLAAAVAQAARDRGGPEIVHQVLVYPPLDHAMDTASYEQDPEWLVFSKADGKWIWDHYLESELDGENPYASPLRAPDLRHLPPATVVTCGFDVLCDEGIAYAARLADADVPVAHRHYDDMIHGFLGMLEDPQLEQARDAVAAIGRDLRDSFARRNQDA